MSKFNNLLNKLSKTYSLTRDDEKGNIYDWFVNFWIKNKLKLSYDVYRVLFEHACKLEIDSVKEMCTDLGTRDNYEELINCYDELN